MEDGLMFHVTTKDGRHIGGFLTPHLAEIWKRLQTENPERYKNDPMREKMAADIQAEELKEKKA